MTVDITIPTVNNPQWLARCLRSICWNTNVNHVGKIMVMGGTDEGVPGGKIVCVPRPDGSTWLDAVRQFLSGREQEEVFIHIQDDCMVLPGNPDWLHTLTRPLFVDPHVGVVACSVTQTGIASQHVRAAIAPGYYLTTAFAPIVFAAKVGAMADAITGIPEDMFCDHEVSLNLMEKGYKIVMATQIAQYHEGMQTNLRVYGGDDPTAWIKKAGERIKEEVPQRHPLRWCQRLDACEMTPVEF